MSVFHNRKNTKMSYGIVWAWEDSDTPWPRNSPRADADLLILGQR